MTKLDIWYQRVRQTPFPRIAWAIIWILIMISIVGGLLNYRTQHDPEHVAMNATQTSVAVPYAPTWAALTATAKDSTTIAKATMNANSLSFSRRAQQTEDADLAKHGCQRVFVNDGAGGTDNEIQCDSRGQTSPP